MPRRWVGPIVWLGALLPMPAHAHLGGLGAGDFWLGFLHPLATPEDAMAFFALGLLCGQTGEDRGLPAILGFCAALVTGALAGHFGVDGVWIAWTNLGSLVVLGGLVALARRLPAALLMGLAFVCGVSHGLTNGTEIVEPIRPWLFLPGFALAGFLPTFYIMSAVTHLRPWWTRIAIRVVASWITAIGLLLMALQTLPSGVK